MRNLGSVQSVLHHRCLVRHTQRRRRCAPCGFNVTVVADLKYVKDSKGKTWAALSMVDAGTCWHVAALLRNRKPRHVAPKKIEGWIRHYGCPRYLIVDQGGEFEGRFNEKCDELGIDASVTASHAAWQHGLAERHGGLLGTMFGRYAISIRSTGRLRSAWLWHCVAKRRVR